ncbi:MAG: UDP-3-O-acyl-N-acetylglucosamine deacetylase [Victivallales bacterium]|jgi:UDP-3-O-acyl-N-acetylglucosamine deacetylase
MAENNTFGILLDGRPEDLGKSYEDFICLPVDQEITGNSDFSLRGKQKTIAKPVEVSAPGTFSKHKISRLRLEPCSREGWWIKRTDLPNSLPIKVSNRNVWTTGDMVSSIVLRSGNPHNYIRLAEHVIALKTGLDVDNLMILMGSGDPPLFEQGSMELVRAVMDAGRVEQEKPVRYFTVKEKVSICGRNGGFMIIAPPDSNKFSLEIDCARNFPNAIGKQRIRFTLNKETFCYGSNARTNTTTRQMLFCMTAGKVFADIRHLGYNRKNVLIAGKRKYINEPKYMHNGKSLEAAWHRANLDLLAAISLIEEGRLIGRITDYKGGHYMDVEMVKLLYANNLLVEVKPE